MIMVCMKEIDTILVVMTMFEFPSPDMWWHDLLEVYRLVWLKLVVYIVNEVFARIYFKQFMPSHNFSVLNYLITDGLLFKGNKTKRTIRFLTWSPSCRNYTECLAKKILHSPNNYVCKSCYDLLFKFYIFKIKCDKIN